MLFYTLQHQSLFLSKYSRDVLIFNLLNSKALHVKHFPEMAF